ncbi:hypothetical protein O181_070595 [Austropuccinia psidii MF-1]|uniref:Uncharacterized protein n=1 Tax=Austropuccinia psidii MF-1 TaxID=1389203 RepID=A0A9Q3EWT2_9BASI|nr:hypothetical protein [Austropuccinia psidii MF-1]
MLEQDGQQLEYNQDLINVPHGSHSVCYSSVSLNTISEVEQTNLIVKEAIGMPNFIVSLQTKAKRGPQKSQWQGRNSIGVRRALLNEEGLALSEQT